MSIRVSRLFIIILSFGYVGLGITIIMAAILGFPNGLQPSYEQWRLPELLNYGHIEVSLKQNGAEGMLYFIIRKLGHFFVYSFIAISLMAMLQMKSRTYKFLLVMAIISTIGTLDEVIQAFLPDRSSLVMDVFVDVMGGFVGIILYIVAHLIVRKADFQVRKAKVVG